MTTRIVNTDGDSSSRPAIAFHKGFRDVDSSPDSAALLAAMDRSNTFESILRYRQRMLELCPLKPGDRILDVGCGLGQEIQRLAGLLGAQGLAAGIDRSRMMISEARRRSETHEGAIEFRVADVHSLPFDDSQFDLARAERTLMYVDNPAAAIAEMARVVTPGGRLAVFEVDFRSLFIDSDHGKLARRIEEACISAVPNPLIGRELPALYRRAGLAIEHIEPMTVRMPLQQAVNIYTGPLKEAVERGVLSRQELAVWWQEQDRMNREGRSCIAHPGYISIGVKG